MISVINVTNKKLRHEPPFQSDLIGDVTRSTAAFVSLDANRDRTNHNPKFAGNLRHIWLGEQFET